MKIYNKSNIDKDLVTKAIIKGNIFVYPTDTIYGIGCNAMISSSILKIREIKKSNKPFSVIAPSKKWVIKNCYINEDAKAWLNKLPGPYTLILPLKNKTAVAKELNNSLDNIGVRIPNNWFSKLIMESGMPFVTTSVNITGNPYLKDLKNIENGILEKVDYVIDDGILNGSPSTIINLCSDNVKIIKR